MSKTRKIVYWIATLWLCLGMAATGIQQLLHQPVPGSVAPPGTEGIQRLGYPVYFLTLIGIWKLLGVVALLVPRFPVLKEWAYAGFFFLTTGALFSHLAVRSAPADLFPAGLLLVLTGVSWWVRPRVYP